MLSKLSTLIFIIFFLPAVSAECPKYTHILVPGYRSGVIIFGGFDLDLDMEGVQDAVQSDTSRLVTAEVKWGWGPSCKGCDVSVYVFGDWRKSELAKLYSGTKGDSGNITSRLSFSTPSEPGNYTLRLIFLIAQEDFVPTFDLTESCLDCDGECHIYYTDGKVTVSEPHSNDSIPPEVRITSPRFSPVLDHGEINIGEVVLVDARVSDPLANVSVRINDIAVEGFPYFWNTSNFTEGEYKIEVVAIDLAGNIGSDEITLELVEKSGVLEPALVWSREELHPLGFLDVSRDGTTIGVAFEKIVKTYDKSGNELVRYELGDVVSALALSGDGGLVVAGSGNRVFLLRNRSIVWSYTAPDVVSALALSGDGGLVVAGSGNRVFLLRNRSIVWSYTAPDVVSALALSGDGGLVVAGSGNKVLYLDVAEKNRSRELSFGGLVSSVSITADSESVLVSTNESLELYKDDDSTWGRSAFNVNRAMIDPNGDYFVYSIKKNLFLYSIEAEPIVEPIEPTGRGFAAVYLIAIVILLLAGGSIWIWRRREAMRTKITISPAEKKFTVRVINQSGNPVEGASVKIGDKEEKTNDAGEAVFDQLVGEHTIVIRKPLYEVYSKVYVSTGKEETLELQLSSSIHLGEEQRDIIRKNRGKLSRSLQEVSSFDKCLPNYYGSIAERFLAFAEGLPNNPEYFVNIENYGEIISDFISVVSDVCESISDIIVDWKNVQIYRASMGLKPADCSADELEEEFYNGFAELVKSPEDYLKYKIPMAKDMLASLDKKISEKMAEFTILPVTGLWKMSKQLLDKSAQEDRYLSAMRVLTASQLLIYTEGMFSSPIIVERLKRTLV